VNKNVSCPKHIKVAQSSAAHEGLMCMIGGGADCSWVVILTITDNSDVQVGMWQRYSKSYQMLEGEAFPGS
jgi:hypothetical protein